MSLREREKDGCGRTAKAREERKKFALAYNAIRIYY